MTTQWELEFIKEYSMWEHLWGFIFRRKGKVKGVMSIAILVCQLRMFPAMTNDKPKLQWLKWIRVSGDRKCRGRHCCLGSASHPCDSHGPSDMKAVEALSIVFKFREGRRRRGSTGYLSFPEAPSRQLLQGHCRKWCQAANDPDCRGSRGNVIWLSQSLCCYAVAGGGVGVGGWRDGWQ